MCEICRITGQNVYADTGVEHDVNEESEDFIVLELQPPETFFVWRRNDGLVGLTEYDPEDVFTDEHEYYILLVTDDYEFAQYQEMHARSCN